MISKKKKGMIKWKGRQLTVDDKMEARLKRGYDTFTSPPDYA